MSLPAAASDQTVAVPVQSLAPLTTDQFTQFLGRFQVTKVLIQGSDKTLKKDSALKACWGRCSPRLKPSATP